MILLKKASKVVERCLKIPENNYGDIFELMKLCGIVKTAALKILHSNNSVN